MKDEREFFASGQVPWVDAGGGVAEQVLSRGPDGMLTRIARWAPGTTTSKVIRHEYVEEVYLLEGELTDLTLQQTFTAGDYACRPPGMPHGPYTTGTGCTMLEIRYSAG
ncbi:quercetin dioxygenase-like cupin family protein [Kribbella aluminosa]|uniref:Quercetin dioxygenase-like cupin family protein n=1 Tax=Kribbella aluminosa TaxID=416017 RepID=A0ABS4UYX2_9ACTN|nr:cupin domain-containing protein [Kribbella aluminosa]MBP2356851.1 quercetin dioxygenase-like cupin family protein [Kribbella aluminosa]